MAIRTELELRAAAVGVDPTAIHNDSVLEHTVLKAEKAVVAAVDAVQLNPTASSLQAVSDGTVTAIDEEE